MPFSVIRSARRTASVSAGLVSIGLLAFALGGWDCGTGSTTGKRPARPTWECPSRIVDSLETGSGTRPEDNYIHLRWHADPTVDHYAIWRRAGTERLDWPYIATDTIAGIRADADGIMEFVDGRVSIGTTYYYVLFAYDEAGNRSVRSDTAFYRLIHKPWLVAPTHNAIVVSRRPTFTFGPLFTARDITTCVVRVRTEASASQRVPETVWISAPVSLTGGLDAYSRTSVSYGVGGTVYLDSLVPGKRYQWRVDFYSRGDIGAKPVPRCCVRDGGCDDDPALPAMSDLVFAGGKSPWVTFTVRP